MTVIRTLVVDDHPLVRDGLIARLNRSDEVEVIGEAGDGRQALQLVEQLNPDVVLMDINMPNLNGISATESILDIYPDILILVLSMHDDREYVTSVISAGARGYVLKSASAEEMFNAIKAVYSGGIYYSPAIADAMLHKASDPVESLTDRETVVLDLLAKGASNKESANTLGISARTVEVHRRNIKKKLGLRSTPALIRFAIDSGLGKNDG
ncbi:MAG: response regulator [Granulosicoccus sp.]